MSTAEIKDRHERAIRFHQQSILVLGFLGGVSFTTLSLIITERTTILQNGNALGVPPELYIDFLTAWVSVTGVVCVMASYQGQRAAAGWLAYPSVAESLAQYLVGIGYLMFIGGLILILLPFSPLGSFAATVAAITLGTLIALAPGHIPKVGSGNSGGQRPKEEEKRKENPEPKPHERVGSTKSEA